MTENTIVLKLPKGVRFDDPQMDEIKRLNSGVEVRKGRQGASLMINQKDFVFDEVDFFEFYTPEGFTFTEKQLDDLLIKNIELKIETNPDGTLIINMNTIAIITSFTFLIGFSIGLWNQIKKAGSITTESGGFKLLKQNKQRMGDVTFTLFEKKIKEIASKCKHITIMPTLCIEIVSNKSSRELEKNLSKIENDWMAEGTDIGLVVDPFRKKYHVFEMNRIGYKELDFNVPFTHNLLPDLILNFNDLLQQAIDMYPEVEFP
jgi:Uma2 family endonuclease